MSETQDYNREYNVVGSSGPVAGVGRRQEYALKRFNDAVECRRNIKSGKIVELRGERLARANNRPRFAAE